MPSVKDETEFLRAQLTERLAQLDLEKLRRLKGYIDGVLCARHEETPLSSLLDQGKDNG
jgi:hypothetical protein